MSITSISEQIAQNLRMIIHQRDVSLLDLSRRSGVSQAHISKILNAKVNATVVLLRQLAQGLDVSLATLLLGVDDDAPNHPMLVTDQVQSLFVGILSVGDRRIACVKDQHNEVVGTSELQGSLRLMDSANVIIEQVKTSINHAMQSHEGEIIYTQMSIVITVHCYEFVTARNKLSQMADKHFAKIVILADWQATYYAAFRHKPGISLVVDKGVSISYLEGQHLHKYGGWGFPIYDIGGEHWLGMRAIRYVIDVTEGFKKQSALSRAIMSRFNGQLEYLIEYCLKHRTSDVYCEFTALLIHSYLIGEQCAQNILMEGFAMVKKYIAHIDHVLGKACRISVNGSLAYIYKKFIDKKRLISSTVDDNKISLLADIAKGDFPLF